MFSALLKIYRKCSSKLLKIQNSRKTFANIGEKRPTEIQMESLEKKYLPQGADKDHKC